MGGRRAQKKGRSTKLSDGFLFLSFFLLSFSLLLLFYLLSLCHIKTILPADRLLSFSSPLPNPVACVHDEINDACCELRVLLDDNEMLHELGVRKGPGIGSSTSSFRGQNSTFLFFRAVCTFFFSFLLGVLSSCSFRRGISKRNKMHFTNRGCCGILAVSPCYSCVVILAFPGRNCNLQIHIHIFSKKQQHHLYHFLL